MMSGAKQSIQYIQYGKNDTERISAETIVEAPVSLTVNGAVWLTFMCTPIDLDAMAVGFLFNEGIIQSADEIATLHICAAGDNIDIWLNHAVEKPDYWRRTSGCTGGTTSTPLAIPDSADKIHPNNGLLLSPGQVTQMIELLLTSQDLYRLAGGVHTSALSDGNNLVVVAEDIGRHNTLDKISGQCLLKKIDLPRRILITTGRVSSEMLQKAFRIKASIVISRTSPSSLSIRMAEQWGITLIGYARRSGFRVYTLPERILSATSAALDSISQIGEASSQGKL